MTLKRAFWILGIAGMIPLAIGLYIRLVMGRELTNLGSIVPWGLWIAQYIYLAGLSAGAYVVSALVYVFHVERLEPIGRLAVFAAIVSLPLGLLAVLLDLGHWERFWYVAAFWNLSSPMAWMILLYSAFMVVVLIQFWFLMRRDLVAARSTPGWRGRVAGVLALGSRETSDAGASRDARVVAVLARIGLVLAVLFPTMVGGLFGVVSSRSYWYSGLFPVVFALSAVASGAALLALVSSIFQDGWRAHRDLIVTLGKILLGLLFLELLLQAAEIGVGLYANDPAFHESVMLVMFGPYWFVFWIGEVAIGFLIPVAILASSLGRDPRFVALAALGSLVGFVGLRLNIVIPGLSPQEIAGLSEAVWDPRVSPNYFPSLFEWLLAIGMVGLWLVLFGLGELFLPLGREHPVAPQPSEA